MSAQSIYDFELPQRKGDPVPLKNYEGKVLIIVNTATGCGFTPHYKDLESMYEKYHDQGLEIIDVPCNQFKNQAPESDDEIHTLCQTKYKTKFEQFKKSDVNGPNQLPLFKFLKEKAPFKGFSGLDTLFTLITILDEINQSNGLSYSLALALIFLARVFFLSSKNSFFPS